LVIQRILLMFLWIPIRRRDLAFRQVCGRRPALLSEN